MTAKPASASARPMRTPGSYSGASAGVRAEPKTLTAGPSSASAPKPSTNSDWMRITRQGSVCTQSDGPAVSSSRWSVVPGLHLVAAAQHRAQPLLLRGSPGSPSAPLPDLSVMYSAPSACDLSASGYAAASAGRTTEFTSPRRPSGRQPGCAVVPRTEDQRGLHSLVPLVGEIGITRAVVDSGHAERAEPGRHRSSRTWARARRRPPPRRRAAAGCDRPGSAPGELSSTTSSSTPHPSKTSRTWASASSSLRSGA